VVLADTNILFDGGSESGAGLLSLASLRVEGAETEVAVRLQRTHAEFLGQGEGLAVVSFGGLDFWRFPLCGNVTEETQGIRLVSPFLVGTR
jgi:hypothetical protein